MCWAALTLHPEFKEGTKAHRPKYKKTVDKHIKQRRERQVLRQAAFAKCEIEDQNAVTVIPEEPVKNATRSDYRRESLFLPSPWAAKSPKLCLFKVEATKESETGVKLSYPKGSRPHSHFAKALGGKSYVAEYDYIILWRCGCPQKTEVAYKEIKELPKKPGRHGVCPLCGAAALQIVEEGDNE